MGKYALISAALSIFVISLLPLHHYLITWLGNQDWMNMAFGLPIGLATAYNIEIVVHKINRKK
jgi:hypothetical protein